jgi:UTP:GlnB (protein PII) uridylyltransferase
LSVLLELLLRQSCNKNLEDIVLTPLYRLAPEEAERLGRQRGELENALVYLKLAELDANTLKKYRFRFIQLLRQELSEASILALVEPLSKYWDWFFTAIPNRYLLSSEIEVLTTQLQQFETSRNKQVRFSYIKGDPGEYDTILFHSLGKINILAKVAYALSWRGVNIETGKINKVVYSNHKEGWVGFFQVSQQADKDELSNVDLETVIAHLIIPPLNPPPISELVESNIQLQYFQEPDKGYLVHETGKDKFDRQVVECIAVKISLYDAPFCFYKMMRSFEAIGIIPQQVTITTIGNQVIDYFYISPEAKAQLESRDFSSVLQKYLNAEISLT